MREESPKNVLLDTSAILALRDNEEGAETVENFLQKAKAGEISVLVSFISFMELYYIIWERGSEELAKITYLELKNLPVKQIDFDKRLLLKAGEFKAKYKFSMADAWIAASAFVTEATLIHKDPDFEAIKDVVKLLALPYNGRTGGLRIK
ncbi:MAG: PIN domain-containing protein [Deltaproteobacteria bacterium]|nr:MAG: PIN domain-containing protein [Deltaproteobacteria bacterium]